MLYPTELRVVLANTALFALCNHGSEPTAHAREKSANDTRKWNPLGSANSSDLRALPSLDKTSSLQKISF
jgi:hypothetical protein